MGPSSSASRSSVASLASFYLPSSPRAPRAVAEGRRRQEQPAAQGLNSIVRALDDARYSRAFAALVVNRAGRVTDLLQYSSSSPEQLPVAEGLAVRDAIRFAFKKCRIEAAELDEI